MSSTHLVGITSAEEVADNICFEQDLDAIGLVGHAVTNLVNGFNSEFKASLHPEEQLTTYY